MHSYLKPDIVLSRARQYKNEKRDLILKFSSLSRPRVIAVRPERILGNETDM